MSPITGGTGSVIEPPVTGRFEGATGDFLGPDTHNGIPVVVRYRWTVLSEDACRWEHALSPDDGKTWETNWYMEMSRSGLRPGRKPGCAARWASLAPGGVQGGGSRGRWER